ncbi:MAG: coenzyme F420-0:L-glutamate ligase [Thaumarchaeota archaeon]|nr:coenzyme F420-0:L-glutamate ligase [Nitrososphaerota archaeon]
MKVIPIHISREVGAGDDIAALILEGARLLDGDILVVAQKIVSKAEGRMVLLDSVRPGLLARGIAGEYGKDPRVVELVLREATHIVRMGGGVIVTRLPSGHICANSGVDVSNVPAGCALPLPVDCDASAARIRNVVWDVSGAQVGVIISDTVGRPFRNGQTDIALGCAGVSPLLDHTGKADAHGRAMRVSVTAVADQLAGAAELAMGKAAGNPAAVVRGTGAAAGNGSGMKLIRTGRELFV